ARLGYLAFVSDMQPRPREDTLLLLGVDGLVDEDLAADLAQPQIDQARAIALSCVDRHGRHLNEKRQVLGQQHVLIENNLAPRQKPARSVAPERILAP